jgi:hypothetical protein
MIPPAGTVKLEVPAVNIINLSIEPVVCPTVNVPPETLVGVITGVAMKLILLF